MESSKDSNPVGIKTVGHRPNAAHSHKMAAQKYFAWNSGQSRFLSFDLGTYKNLESFLHCKIYDFHLMHWLSTFTFELFRFLQHNADRDKAGFTIWRIALRCVSVTHCVYLWTLRIMQTSWHVDAPHRNARDEKSLSLTCWRKEEKSCRVTE